MKIATWNLERALPQSVQAERQRQWLNRIDADIWILTETHLDIAPGKNYYSVASGLPERPGAEGERWVQIWVKAGELVPLTTIDEARTAAALLTLGSGQQWVVYGTVLPWLGSSWRWSKTGQHGPMQPASQGQAFAAALAAQQADWQLLRTTYPKAILTVAGDFNQDLNALHYYGSRRNKQALRQALDSVKLVCLTAGEHDPVHQLIDGQHSNIDHICIASNVEEHFQNSFAWPQRLDDLRGLSDHFGIGVELGFEP
ncbi:endonuclease/exonuclease/phosphatase family protein [Nodosilinea sp. LEGE 06152]|uniref:endonuclease/exonuclease/phosphatase family protein n=1 Tax=Nodosilinea sp. LEGE 06152 TaxID=2777966 RepID=UPI00187E2985|nr:endonuclease/exonuclease/phosphatase family protein [Nodosilinea sp. LEGE 06152]MBE9156352.1 endonuclease/exonuclease/phosphatase family protein [Nodosilinea sp. LEGE 06152]